MTRLENDNRRELYKAFRLNERQRSLITLKYFRSFNNRQIFGLTGINEGTVSTLCTRTIEKIRCFPKLHHEIICINAHKTKEKWESGICTTGLDSSRILKYK